MNKWEGKRRKKKKKKKKKKGPVLQILKLTPSGRATGG